MKIDLKKYMNERDQLRAQIKDPGPIVTLSRQYGCEANDVTMKLLARVNYHLGEKSVNAKPWRYINKEIIQEAASALKLSEERIEQRVIQHQESSNMMGQMFKSLSSSKSLSDVEIIQKINEIIQTYAHDGKVIIVGRGGAMLTRNITNAIHARIFAPYEWRVAYVAEKNQLSQMEAEQMVNTKDLERIHWKEHLTGKKFDEYQFDILLNRASVSTDEMVDILFNMMINRALI